MSYSRLNIALAICLDGRGRVIVGNRPETRDLAGMLEFPGGRIEAGETPQLAAVRELMEEACVKAAPAGEWAAFDWDYPHVALRLFPVICRPTEPDVAPGGGFRWMRCDALRAEDFPPANAALIARLCAPPGDAILHADGAGLHGRRRT